MAVLYREMRRYNEAIKMFNRALKILESVYGSGHPYIQKIQRNIISINKNTGR